MKKIYESVEMNVTEFETEDIILTSKYDLENEDLFGEPAESGTGMGGGEF